MRDLLIIVSLLIFTAFGVINPRQFSAVGASMIWIDQLNEWQLQLADDQHRAHLFYRQIMMPDRNAADLFESFSEGSFFSFDYAADAAIADEGVSGDELAISRLLTKVLDVRTDFNRLNFDPTHSDDSLRRIQEWSQQVDSVYSDGRMLAHSLVAQQV